MAREFGISFSPSIVGKTANPSPTRPTSKDIPALTKAIAVQLMEKSMKKKSLIPPNGEIPLYQAPDGTARLNVRVNESVWLNIDQMALPFGVDKSGISRHLKNIFTTGAEL